MHGNNENFLNITGLSYPTSENLVEIHNLRSTKKKEEKCQDTAINLSEFIPEPKSVSHILRMNKCLQENWDKLFL